MKPFNQLLAFAVTVSVTVVAGASTASAYSISGGAYTATATSNPTITVGGGAYTIACTNWSASGTATGTDTTAMTPAISGCTFFGFPFFVTQSGAWNVKVTGVAGGRFTADLEIPAGTTTTWNSPIAGCTFVIAGPQSFSGVAMTNYVGGANLSAAVSGLAYTATGCPFSSGTDGTYDTNGEVTIPGITVS